MTPQKQEETKMKSPDSDEVVGGVFTAVCLVTGPVGWFVLLADQLLKKGE